jgi:glyoxylase-like metal-dependent hydrolase (beta-lactamase superfamily II)
MLEAEVMLLTSSIRKKAWNRIDIRFHTFYMYSSLNFQIPMISGARAVSQFRRPPFCLHRAYNSAACFAAAAVTRRAQKIHAGCCHFAGIHGMIKSRRRSHRAESHGLCFSSEAAANMAEIKEIKYGNTNCYAICSGCGCLLFDTDWAGTFQQFRRALKSAGIVPGPAAYLLISHYHPDHMGIAQDIASMGVKLLAADIQKEYIHAADHFFAVNKAVKFSPVVDSEALIFSCGQSRRILASIGIDGEIIPTPGHSDDSVSLILDCGAAFVGDLYPLFSVPAFKNAALESSWNRILSHGVTQIFYGHSNPQKISGIRSVSDIPAEYR